MAKPKIKLELESRMTREELYDILKDIVFDIRIDDITYSKEYIDNLIETHNHDTMYLTIEQYELSNNNDWGTLFDDYDIENL